MPRLAGARPNSPTVAVTRPGIYASLLPWAQDEYAASGDPRWRFCHADGDGGVCRSGAECEHGDPPPNPARRGLLDALEDGRPVELQAWIARGHRWTGQGWSPEEFALPWDPKAVRHVRVTADDTVTPA